MLVPAAQQREPTSYLRIHLPSCASFPRPLRCAPLGLHGAPSWAPWDIRQLPTSYLFYTWECVYVGPAFWIIPPSHSYLCPQVHSLCLHLRFSSFKLGSFRMNGIVHQYFPMQLQQITAYKHGSLSKTCPASVPHPHHVADQVISSLWALLPGSLLCATILCRVPARREGENQPAGLN